MSRFAIQSLPRLISSRLQCATTAPLQYRLPIAQTSRLYSAVPEPLQSPVLEGQKRQFPPKIQSIVGDISKLTLVEVADLNELLKQELRIQDMPMMMAGAVAPAQSAADDDEDDVEVKREKTAFTVKLVKYDETKKISLIKEIKSLMPGMNLVQAKKFVEAIPQAVQTDIGKDEAEKLKEALTAVGGVVEVE